MIDKYEQRFEEIAEESRALVAELEDLMTTEPFDQEAFDAAQVRSEALEVEADTLKLRITEFKLRQERLDKVRRYAESGHSEAGAGAPVYQKPVEDPYDLSTVKGVGEQRTNDLRARALTALERTSDWEFESRAAPNADASKSKIANLLEHGDDRSSTIANLVLATNSPMYKRAWLKAVTDRKEMLTGAEAEALQRAMSLTDTAGGFAVPMPIDPTLIELGDGAATSVRSYARVETTTVDVWRGLSSTQLTASWDAEGAEVSDDTTTFAQPSISVHKASAFVPATIEVAQDYPNLVNDLGTLFADGKARLESAAFATGSGAGQPFGVVTSLVAGGSIQVSAGADAFAVADMYNLIESVGPRYRQSGVGRQAWAANFAIINEIRAFGAAVSHAFTVDMTAEGIPAVFGRPIFEMSDMDGTYGAVENYVLIFGDWNAGYTIVDRVGFSVEYIPHLFHTGNNRPSGSRGWYAYWRTGADVTNIGALSVLNVT